VSWTQMRDPAQAQAIGAVTSQAIGACQGQAPAPQGPTTNVTVTTSTPTATTPASATGTTAASGSAGPHIEAQINLVPTNRASKALAVANVIRQGQQRAFSLQAQGLAPTRGFAYAAWLYNSQTDALSLGFAPAVKADGRVQVIGALPSNASRYRALVLTRETTARPAQPGPIVLAGQLAVESTRRARTSS
jgi:hypothetical protein